MFRPDRYDFNTKAEYEAALNQYNEKFLEEALLLLLVLPH
jgi:hypothetical protein